MTAPYQRGQLAAATVRVASVNGRPIERTYRVSGYCEVLARLVDPQTKQPCGWIVQGYDRTTGLRFIGEVALDALRLAPQQEN